MFTLNLFCIFRLFSEFLGVFFTNQIRIAEFRIHEQIIPSIRRAQGEVGWTGIYVVHSGSDQSQQGRARKLTRDFRLLEKECFK